MHHEILVQIQAMGFKSRMPAQGFCLYDHSIGKFGAVAYNRELSEKEIEAYELRPMRVEGDE